MNKKILLAFLLCALTTASFAQVTIGSANAPQKAAILDLKTKEPNAPTSVSDSKNATTDQNGGGLLLPRVELVSINELKPFITTATADDKIRNAGLTVYNIKDSKNDSLEVGLYIWNGVKWQKSVTSTANRGEVIWLPSGNLPWGSAGTSLSINLFTEYEKAYMPSSPSYGNSYLSSTNGIINVPDHANSKTDFHYVVSYFDNSVIDITSITPEGIMYYKPKVDVTPDNAFMNIMMIRK